MGGPSSGRRVTGVVLAADVRRDRLRELQAAMEARRDSVADLDLEIEDLLAEIAGFDALLQANLRQERRELDRVEALVRMLERWTALLDEAPRRQIPRAGAGIEARRVRELHQREALVLAESEDDQGADDEEPPPKTPPKAGPSGSTGQRLKAAYRELARRFHPDLARTEEQRVEFGRLMARINEYYRQRDLRKLTAMARETKTIEIEPAETDLDEQIRVAQRRLQWFDTVLENLHEERKRIENSPSCKLWRRHQRGSKGPGAGRGRDPFAEHRKQLRARILTGQRAVGDATVGLEVAVTRYNRRGRGEGSVARGRGAQRLSKIFDPMAGQRFARLVLDELSIERDDPRVRARADWIEDLAKTDRAGLRLVILAYVSDLSPLPLPGLDRYEDVRVRFDHLGAGDDEPPSLPDAMARLADCLEFGVRRATPKRVNTGFRLRSDEVRRAMPLALQRSVVRRELRRILQVLGEAVRCTSCDEDVFLIPLFRSSGFDDLRATVCPACGATHEGYWLPKGDDVQALLNPAYLDLEIVTKWSFELGRGHAETQLVPVEVETMTVGDLKARLHADLFARYEIEVSRGQLRMMQAGRRVAERTPLLDVASTAFELRFGKGAKVDEAEAVELLRHRIRHRFDG